MAVGSCDFCTGIDKCPTCGEAVTGFNHVGVRAIAMRSGIWHWAVPCGHRIDVAAVAAPRGAAGTSGPAVYNGGPLWQAGYKWQNVYWGSYWQGTSLRFGPLEVDGAAKNIATDPSYWGGLSEYGAGMSPADDFLPSVVIAENPPASVDDSQIGAQIKSWIAAGLIPELGQEGAYNIFFPPGTTVTLQGSASCSVFCDYHNFDGTHFYTVEPYPCSAGCNQCTQDDFDTLTQGLSEELVELATDMNPGTGWVIGNEELCDYCDAAFVCNQITSGEYVNAWYSNALGKCWGKATTPPPPGTQCQAQIEAGLGELLSGQVAQGLEDLVSGIECLVSAGVLDRKQLVKMLLEEHRAQLEVRVNDVKDELDSVKHLLERL